jgi:hypothetical protein
MGKLFSTGITRNWRRHVLHLPVFISFLVLQSHRTIHTQTELLRLSRTNFSEAYQILVHLKIVRLFVESVLRYGLPANYVGIVIKVWLHSILDPFWAFTRVRSQTRSRRRRRSPSSYHILHTFLPAHKDKARPSRSLEAKRSSPASGRPSWSKRCSISSSMKSHGS